MGDSGSGSGGGPPTSPAALEAKINAAFAELQTQIADEINKVKQAQKEKRAAMEEKLKAIIAELEKAVDKTPATTTTETDPELEAKLDRLRTDAQVYDDQIRALEHTIADLAPILFPALKGLYTRKLETLKGLWNEYLELQKKTKAQHEFAKDDSKAAELAQANDAIAEINAAIEMSKSYLDEWNDIIGKQMEGGDMDGKGDLKPDLKETVKELSGKMASVNDIHKKYSIPDVFVSDQGALGHGRPRPIHAPSSPFVPSGRRRTQPSNFFKL